MESGTSRTEQLQALLDDRGLDALLLRRPANFAWYTDGADNRVDHASPYGVADVVITRGEPYILTNTIEARRLEMEQTPGFAVRSYPWYEPAPSVGGAGRVGADVAAPGLTDLSDQIAALRLVLDQSAIQRYREVGRDAMGAMTEAVSGLAPGISEWEVMARVEASCRRRGLFSPVVLVAGDERIVRYRHPISSDATCRRRVMIVLCAERGGLYANFTRFVHFGEPSDDWQQREHACERILRRLREEVTLPGRTLTEAFYDCLGLYAEENYPDEWRLHHQGGLTGYASREIVATLYTEQEIRIGNAFAWNPSITGAKAEETFIVTENGPEVIAS